MFVCLSLNIYSFVNRSMQSEGDHVLFPAEAEVFINELMPTSVENIGSDR